MDETYIVDDIFLEICEYLDIKDILSMSLSDHNHRNIIQQHHFKYPIRKLKNTNDINEKIKYLTDNFNFTKYDLSSCWKITDESVKLLGNCNYLDLSHCDITDESVKLL